MTRTRLLGAVVAVLALVLMGVTAVMLSRHHHRSGGFPEIDHATLTDTQARVIDVLNAQFDAQPAGATFSEGVEEPWCADFVSWVMRNSDVPLHNPNSGSWRIPGVYTMQEYYQSIGRLAAPDYQPHPGDVMLWGEGSRMGLHANIVVAVSYPDITTVGGNEGGIRVGHATISPDSHLLGYGLLG